MLFSYTARAFQARTFLAVWWRQAAVATVNLIEQDGGSVYGEGVFKTKAGRQYASARPGGKHGKLPPLYEFTVQYQHQEIERQLARFVVGDGSLEQAGFSMEGSGYITGRRMYGEGFMVSAGASVSGAGEFFDVELEMFALLMAA